MCSMDAVALLVCVAGFEQICTALCASAACCHTMLNQHLEAKRAQAQIMMVEDSNCYWNADESLLSLLMFGSHFTVHSVGHRMHYT